MHCAQLAAVTLVTPSPPPLSLGAPNTSKPASLGNSAAHVGHQRMFAVTQEPWRRFGRPAVEGTGASRGQTVGAAPPSALHTTKHHPKGRHASCNLFLHRRKSPRTWKNGARGGAQRTGNTQTQTTDSISPAATYVRPLSTRFCLSPSLFPSLSPHHLDDVQGLLGEVPLPLCGGPLRLGILVAAEAAHHELAQQLRACRRGPPHVVHQGNRLALTTGGNKTHGATRA